LPKRSPIGIWIEKVGEDESNWQLAIDNRQKAKESSSRQIGQWLRNSELRALLLSHIRYSAFGIWHPASGIRYLVSGIWHPASGAHLLFSEIAPYYEGLTKISQTL